MRNDELDTALLELQLASLPVTPDANDRPALAPFDWSEDAIAAAFERDFGARASS
jgi:hypothetical protein